MYSMYCSDSTYRNNLTSSFYLFPLSFLKIVHTTYTFFTELCSLFPNFYLDTNLTFKKNPNLKQKELSGLHFLTLC